MQQKPGIQEERGLYLTGRQREVLDGLMEGLTQAQIGLRLGIRERSVRHHVDALKQRLGAASIGELVALAIRGGWA